MNTTTKPGVLMLMDADSAYALRYPADWANALAEARPAVERLATAAGAGSPMKLHGDGKEGLWFGPEKTAELRAALAAFRGES